MNSVYPRFVRFSPNSPYRLRIIGSKCAMVLNLSESHHGKNVSGGITVDRAVSLMIYAREGFLICPGGYGGIVPMRTVLRS